MKLANQFYLDASALAKRYSPELGTLVLNHLFLRVSPTRIKTLHLGVAEVVSILVRKRNAKRLSPRLHAQAFSTLESEIINQPLLKKFDADADLINLALPLISQHSINATDAVLLCSAIDLVNRLRADNDDLVLVASDHRLLRAAQVEGLLTFNPETQTTADLDLLLV